jgi:urate oxidase
MSIVLGPDQYGRAENRVVRIYRDTDRHEIRDVNVSTSLRGDFTDAHINGDQARVLPTGTQKNTCHTDDRPSGLIQRCVTRDDAPVPGLARQTMPGLA